MIALRQVQASGEIPLEILADVIEFTHVSSPDACKFVLECLSESEKWYVHLIECWLRHNKSLMIASFDEIDYEKLAYLLDELNWNVSFIVEVFQRLNANETNNTNSNTKIGFHELKHLLQFFILNNVDFLQARNAMNRALGFVASNESTATKNASTLMNAWRVQVEVGLIEIKVKQTFSSNNDSLTKKISSLLLKSKQ